MHFRDPTSQESSRFGLGTRLDESLQAEIHTPLNIQITSDYESKIADSLGPRNPDPGGSCTPTEVATSRVGSKPLPYLGQVSAERTR